MNNLDYNIKSIQKQLQQRSDALNLLKTEDQNSDNKSKRLLLPALYSKPNNAKLFAPSTTVNKTGRSLAVQSEINFGEVFSETSTLTATQKVNFCFNLLDELGSNAGPLSPVIAKVSAKLKEFTYSTSVTSLEADKPAKMEVSVFSDSKELSESELVKFGVERVPYFELYDSLKRSPESETLRSKLLVLGDKYRKLEQRLSEQNEEAFRVRDLILQREKTVAKQNERLKELEGTLEQVTANRNILEAHQRQQMAEMRQEIETLTNTNKHNESVIKKLAVFNQNSSECEDSDIMNASKTSHTESTLPVLLSSQKVLEYDLETGLYLQHQFGEIISQTLEDYETSVFQSRYTSEKLAESSLRKNGAKLMSKSANYAKMSEEDFEAIKSKFKLQISQLLKEEMMLRQHLDSLRLSSSADKNADSTMVASVMQRTQDVALRRYGVTVQYSCEGDQDGNFYPLPGIDHCFKCNAETVSCPHQTSVTASLKVALPKRATHLLFSCPTLSRGGTSNDATGQMPTTGTQDFSKQKPEDSAEYELLDAHEIYKKRKQRRRMANARGLGAYWLLSRDHFECRKAQPTIAPRVFGLEKVLLLVKETMRFRFSEEMALLEGLSLFSSIHEIGCFADSFYRYLDSKYASHELGLRVAFETLSSLRTVETQHPLVKLFLEHMTGEKVALWRYCFLAMEYYRSLDPDLNAAGCRKVMSFVYPRNDAEATQQIELEQLSLSSGILNVEGLGQHLFNSIAEKCEPNYKIFLRLFRQVVDSLAPVGADRPANDNDSDDEQHQELVPFDAFDQAISKILKSVPSQVRLMNFQAAEHEIVRRKTLLTAEHEDEEHSYLENLSRCSAAPEKNQLSSEVNEAANASSTLTINYYASNGFDGFIEKQMQNIGLYGIPISACAEVACSLALHQLRQNNWNPVPWGLFPWEMAKETIAAAVDASSSPTEKPTAEDTEGEDNSVSRREVVKPVEAPPPLNTIVGTSNEPPLQIEGLPEFKIKSKIDEPTKL